MVLRGLVYLFVLRFTFGIFYEFLHFQLCIPLIFLFISKLHATRKSFLKKNLQNCDTSETSNLKFTKNHTRPSPLSSCALMYISSPFLHKFYFNFSTISLNKGLSVVFGRLHASTISPNTRLNLFTSSSSPANLFAKSFTNNPYA